MNQTSMVCLLISDYLAYPQTQAKNYHIQTIFMLEKNILINLRFQGVPLQIQSRL